jgi:hypothetical protein
MKDILKTVGICLSVLFTVQLIMQIGFWITYTTIMFIFWEPLQVNWGIMRLMIVIGFVVTALAGMFAYLDKDN